MVTPKKQGHWRQRCGCAMVLSKYLLLSCWPLAYGAFQIESEVRIPEFPVVIFIRNSPLTSISSLESQSSLNNPRWWQRTSALPLTCICDSRYKPHSKHWPHSINERAAAKINPIFLCFLTFLLECTNSGMTSLPKRPKDIRTLTQLPGWKS